MRILNTLLNIICFLTITVIFQSCSDSLEEHVSVTDSKLQESLAERISEDPELSEFYQLLKSTGYDQVLSSSKSFTVWAPSNSAISQVPSDLIDDPSELDRFIANHISISSFSTDMVEDTIRVQMLTKKYADFVSGPAIADANINLANEYAANGVYHIIDKALVPKLNLWEYITTNPDGYEQNDFIASLSDFDLFNSENDENEEESVEESEDVLVDQDSIVNEILKTGYYIKNEQKKFTYFVMTDDAFQKEKNKMMPYTQKPSQDSTGMLAKYYVARDMIFEGIYTRENLPDTLISRFGVKIPIDQEGIIGDPIELSNGIVYRMEGMDVDLQDKLLPVKLEGEEPIGFSQNDKRNYIFYRERTDPSGEYFQDIVAQNHGVPEFKIHYSAPNLYSTTYRVYWRAINDFEGSFWQHVRIGGGVEIQEDGTVTEIEPIAEYDALEVPPNNYEEVFIGEFTLENAGNVDLISLIAENEGSNRWNPLSLDYLKLVPIVE